MDDENRAYDYLQLNSTIHVDSEGEIEVQTTSSAPLASNHEFEGVMLFPQNDFNENCLCLITHYFDVRREFKWMLWRG